MPGSTVVDQNVTATPDQTTQAAAAASPQPDLMTRVSQFKKPEESKKPDANATEPIFDVKEIDAIKDPVAKVIAEKAYKSLQGDYTRKTQALAEELKRQTETSSNQRQTWTADRIQKELLSDPTFVAEAQRLAQVNPNPANPNTSGLSEEEWSALTPQEKAKFNLLESKISQLEQRNNEALEMQKQTFLTQQHQTLKGKYANYAPDIVDTTVKNILQQKQQIGLEDVWKALDYENAVTRAYELGKLDASGKNQQRVNSMSFDGGMVNGATPPVEAQKGESNASFFKRIAANRLAQAQSK